VAMQDHYESFSPRVFYNWIGCHLPLFRANTFSQKGSF
jgi:hypothetical protein